MASDLRSRTFQQFVRTEAAGGLVLLVAAVLALVVANSPLGPTYDRLWNTVLVVGPQDHALSLSARAWVNDALMALFFLLVGLEIKRELLVGELASVRQAALPIAAALGGVIVPALIYLLLAPEGTGRGWAIPTATDIAFALAVVAIAAPAAPAGLKVFLAALAIVDDMSAVIVIAVGYTAAVHLGALLTAGAVVVLLIGLNRLGVRVLWPYLVLGAALWLAVHESGVHATIAGVVLALTIPTATRIDAPVFAREARALVDAFDAAETGDGLVITSPGQQHALHALDAAASAVSAPLLRLEHALHGVAAFVVMPVFAFANAGVPLGTAAVDGGLALAVAAGLVAGKPLGITAAAWIACRSGLAALPAGVTWRMLHGVAWIAGIGFTMALFIGNLAFGDGPAYVAAQTGILGGSFLAAMTGAVLVRRAVAADAAQAK
jgi:NhaA family Na+:H+ antiporter